MITWNNNLYYGNGSNKPLKMVGENNITDVHNIGDIVLTTKTSLGSKYLLCNGSTINSATYPELSSILGQTDLTSPFSNGKYDFTHGCVFNNQFWCIIENNKPLYHGNDVATMSSDITLPQTPQNLLTDGYYLYFLHANSSSSDVYYSQNGTSWNQLTLPNVNINDASFTFNISKKYVTIVSRSDSEYNTRYYYWSRGDSPTSVQNIQLQSSNLTSMAIDNDFTWGLLEESSWVGYAIKFNTMFPERESGQRTALNSTVQAGNTDNSFYTTENNDVVLRPTPRSSGINSWIVTSSAVTQFNKTLKDCGYVHYYNGKYLFPVSNILYQGDTVSQISSQVNSTLPDGCTNLLYCNNQYLAIADKNVTSKFLKISTQLPTISISSGTKTVRAFIKALD